MPTWPGNGLHVPDSAEIRGWRSHPACPTGLDQLFTKGNCLCTRDGNKSCSKKTTPPPQYSGEQLAAAPETIPICGATGGAACYVRLFCLFLLSAANPPCTGGTGSLCLWDPCKHRQGLPCGKAPLRAAPANPYK